MQTQTTSPFQPGDRVTRKSGKARVGTVVGSYITHRQHKTPGRLKVRVRWDQNGARSSISDLAAETLKPAEVA